MPKAPRRSRTHRRHEIAPARPPVLIGVIVVACAVLLFAALSQLLN